jgi:AcrR family transcriptional regulator
LVLRTVDAEKFEKMADSSNRPGRGRPRTFDRDHVIDVAMDSYWREGLNALSLNEICRRAEVSKPGLYREFGGEDGLMTAALDQYREMVVLPLLSILSTDRPFAEVLSEVVHRMTEDRGTPAGCLFAKMRSSPARLGTVASAQVAALRDEMRSVYEACYQRARIRGEVNDTIAPSFAALYIDTQLTTVLGQMAAGESPDLVRTQAQLAFASLLPS